MGAFQNHRRDMSNNTHNSASNFTASTNLHPIKSVGHQQFAQIDSITNFEGTSGGLSGHGAATGAAGAPRFGAGGLTNSFHAYEQDYSVMNAGHGVGVNSTKKRTTNANQTIFSA